MAYRYTNPTYIQLLYTHISTRLFKQCLVTQDYFLRKIGIHLHINVHSRFYKESHTTTNINLHTHK